MLLTGFFMVGKPHGKRMMKMGWRHKHETEIISRCVKDHGGSTLLGLVGDSFVSSKTVRAERDDAFAGEWGHHGDDYTEKGWQPAWEIRPENREKYLPKDRFILCRDLEAEDTPEDAGGDGMSPKYSGF
jgi:hypothetical protein